MVVLGGFVAEVGGFEDGGVLVEGGLELAGGLKMFETSLPLLSSDF